MPRSLTETHKAKLGAANRGKQAGNKHPNWGKKLSAETRQRISVSMRRVGANRKPDDQVSVPSLHQWLRGNFPWAGMCSNCGKPRPATRNHDLANISGHVYTRDPADYREMCRACHLAFDYSHGRQTKKPRNP